MSDIKLSGEFQPNVYLDFGQGKIFSNRWAHGYVPFDTMGWKKTDNEKPLYVYAENDDGSLYNTGIECPSTLMCLDPNGNRSIKVDIFKGIELNAFGEIIRLDKYSLRFEYLSQKDVWTDEEENEYLRLYDEIFTTKTDYETDDGAYLEPIYKNPGVNYKTKEPEEGKDLLKYERSDANDALRYEKAVVIRPQALCMPMIRPVCQTYGDGEDKIEVFFGTVTDVDEGDTYTITVLPNKFALFCEDEISNTVLLFADRRRLMAESYLGKGADRIISGYTPDKRIDYSKDNVDNYSGRFKINGEFADLILLHTGTTITLKAVHDHVTIAGEEKDIVYWNVENRNAFKKFSELSTSDIALRFTHRDFGEGEARVDEGLELVTYCSNLYNGTLDVEEARIPIDIRINTRDNCFENAFYLQDNTWWVSWWE